MDAMFTQSYMHCYFCQCEGSLVVVKAMEGTIPWAACWPILFIIHDCYTQRSLTVTHRWLDFPPSTSYVADMHGKEGGTLLLTHHSTQIRTNSSTEAEVSQILHLLMLRVIINPWAGFGHESGSYETTVPQRVDLSLMGSRLSPLSPATY